MSDAGVKTVIYNGMKYCRDSETGYYKRNVKGSSPLYLHRDVYFYNKNRIPKGHDIHHIDFDKNNNSIDNLISLPRQEHSRIHRASLSEDQLQKIRDNLTNKARPKACIWHGSKEGIDFHKLHYKKYKHLFHQKKAYKCECCGVVFTTQVGKNLFCSNKCKSKSRRDSGVDNVSRICCHCNKPFKVNKYAKTETCSRSCTNRLCASRKRFAL